MGLDLWFREDVARILASTHETLRGAAGAVAPLDEERAAAYQQGFEDALRAVGVAFGVMGPGLGSGRNGHGGPGIRRLNSGHRDVGIWTGEER
jgi:hypothetical protein